MADYDYRFETEEQEALRRARRKARMEEMRRKKKRALLIRKLVLGGATAAVVLGVVLGITLPNRNKKANAEETVTNIETVVDNGETTENNLAESGELSEVNTTENGEVVEEPTEEFQVFSATTTAATTGFSDEVISDYGIVIDVSQGTILASKGGFDQIYPASMTKALTVLTAARALGLDTDDWENAAVLDDTFTMIIEITDYSYVHDCSNVGFEVGEEVSVRDLFYGTIMPSGADAALGLAYYVAGSQEAFVELMNEELARLGMSSTSHMTNCVGLYGDDHYSTPYDMAVILKTATDMPFLREVMSTRRYTTGVTEEHEEGISISNLFLRRIEDKDTNGEVLCAKTGFVVQSKNCAVSLGKDKEGNEYLICTAGSTSAWRAIYDHVALYQRWLPEDDETP